MMPMMVRSVPRLRFGTRPHCLTLSTMCRTCSSEAPGFKTTIISGAPFLPDRLQRVDEVLVLAF